MIQKPSRAQSGVAAVSRPRDDLLARRTELFFEKCRSAHVYLGFHDRLRVTLLWSCPQSLPAPAWQESFERSTVHLRIRGEAGPPLVYRLYAPESAFESGQCVFTLIAANDRTREAAERATLFRRLGETIPEIEILTLLVGSSVVRLRTS